MRYGQHRKKGTSVTIFFSMKISIPGEEKIYATEQIRTGCIERTVSENM
jgi:hypothetical protein